MTHIVGKLDGVLRGIAEHRNQATSAIHNGVQPTSLQQRIEQVRSSVSEQGGIKQEPDEQGVSAVSS